MLEDDIIYKSTESETDISNPRILTKAVHSWFSGKRSTTEKACSSASVLMSMFEVFVEVSGFPLFIDHSHTDEGGYILENFSGLSPYKISVGRDGRASLISSTGDGWIFSPPGSAQETLFPVYEKFIDGWVNSIVL